MAHQRNDAPVISRGKKSIVLFRAAMPAAGGQAVLFAGFAQVTATPN